MPKRNTIDRAFLLLLIPLCGCLFLWAIDSVSNIGFEYSVPQISLFSVFETRWLYLSVHAFTLIPIFLLSFDKRVHFHTRWKKLLPAILIVATFFIIWDVVFTKMGIWGFNEKYHLAFSLLGLPIEEWLFFFSVPFACLFIYACLNHYITKDILAPIDQIVSLGLGSLLILIGLLHLNQLYTSTTFLLTGSFILFHFWKFENTYRSRFYLAYLVSWVPFILVDGVLTGGFTEQPIVLYHPEEFLGIRIGSIPLEDSIYSLLMLMSITTIFEYNSKSQTPPQFQEKPFLQ